MLIGVLADIHGNVRALEAVLADLRARAVDATINLGDCVSGPLWPRETFELLQANPMPTLRGNHDRAVGAGTPEAMGASDRFAHAHLTPPQRAWLAALPFEHELDHAWCFHANPSDDTEYFLEDVVAGSLALAPVARIAARLGTPRRKLVLCGHSHQPRLVHLDGGTLILNPGSVGAPAYVSTDPEWHACETGTPHARYALVELGAGAPRIEHVALAYDWEAAARVAAGNGQPGWAHALRTGYAQPETATPR